MVFCYALSRIVIGGSFLAYLVVLSAHHRYFPPFSHVFTDFHQTHSIETFRMICHMAAFAIIHSHRFHGIFICFCRFGMVYRYMT
ncbi:hypothetical protein J3A83DRAFT_4245138 [Scleroderma citrinum]